MTIPTQSAASLGGGSLISGMVIVLTIQLLYSHGIQWDLGHDRKRQTVLNLLCLIAGLNGIVAYPVNQTETSVALSNITTWIMFLAVQYTLMIINHNSLVRGYNSFASNSQPSANFKRLCLLLYLLPVLTMIPVYMASSEKVPSNSLINSSDYNKRIFKPINLTMVIVTELFAVITDLLLLRRVDQVHKAMEFQGKSEHDRISKDLWMNYIVTWFFLLSDVLIKVLIIYNIPLLFDSILSIATSAMRARCNLEYGLHMKSLIEPCSRSNPKVVYSDDLKMVSIH